MIASRPVPAGTISSSRRDAAARWRASAVGSRANDPAQEPTTSPGAARDALKAAQTCLEVAARSFGEAQAAAARGRDLLDRCAQEVERYAAHDRRISSSRAASVKAAIRAGNPAVFETDSSIPANAAARAEAQNQKTAAEMAVADLQFEENEAASGLHQARTAVDDAVRGVLVAEAVEIATRAEALAAEAAKLRMQLGGLYAPVDQMKAGSPTILRAIQANAEVEHNSPEFHTIRRAADKWSTFESSLRSDPDAELDFE